MCLNEDIGIHGVHSLFHSDPLLYWKDKLLSHCYNFFFLAADNFWIMLVLEISILQFVLTI